MFAQTAEQGALPTLYAATAPDVQGGDYYGPDGFQELRGQPDEGEGDRRGKGSCCGAQVVGGLGGADGGRVRVAQRGRFVARRRYPRRTHRRCVSSTRARPGLVRRRHRRREHRRLHGRAAVRARRRAGRAGRAAPGSRRLQGRLHAPDPVQRRADDRAARTGAVARAGGRGAEQGGGLDAVRGLAAVSGRRAPRLRNHPPEPRSDPARARGRNAGRRVLPRPDGGSACSAIGGGSTGVEVERPDHKRRALRATLTVAADGRDSTIARLARVPARVRPHNRFVYFAYWRGVRSPKSEARVWMLDPDAAAVFPNEDGLTVIAAVPHKARLPEFRADPEAAYGRMIGALPDGPDLAGAERVSKLIGKLEMPNKMRPAARPGTRVRRRRRARHRPAVRGRLRLGIPERRVARRRDTLGAPRPRRPRRRARSATAAPSGAASVLTTCRSPTTRRDDRCG